MRICAFLNCGNSTYTIERWRQEICKIHSVIHETNSCNCPRPFTLFPFPSEKNDPEGRKKWIKLVNRKSVSTSITAKNWVPSIDSRVCSRHFIDGKPTKLNPDPVLNLGYVPLIKYSKARPGPKLRSPPKKVSKLDTTDPGIIKSNENSGVLHDHTYNFTCECSSNCTCKGCIIKQREIINLKHENELLKVRLDMINSDRKTKPKINPDIFLKTDKKVNNYTGLVAKSVFFALLNLLIPVARQMKYWRGKRKVVSAKRKFKQSPAKIGPSRKLVIKHELLLVLMKLRLGLTNRPTLLADIFQISTCTCSQIFNTWLKMMSRQLKPLIYWPDKDEVHEQLPSKLRKKFPNLRCTIDCTEVPIDRPRHLEIQALTWSDYKKHNTVKFLIGIAPNGMVCFLSKAWGGRTSDRHITRESGFLDLVEPFDTILADRGFPIQEDLLLRRATLFIPPPSSGLDQQSKRDVNKTKVIANARIHVERAIGRIKCFKILKNTLPINLIPLIDDIAIVCSALSNLLLPLVD